MNDLKKRYLEVVTTYYKTVAYNLRKYSYSGKDVGLDIFIIDFLGNNASCTMTEIAKFLNVKSPSTATKRIDRLVDFGFVDRSSSKKDRRKVELELTESGRKLYENFLNNRLTAMRIIMEYFNEDELETFLNIVERLLKLSEDFKPNFL